MREQSTEQALRVLIVDGFNSTVGSWDPLVAQLPPALSCVVVELDDLIDELHARRRSPEHPRPTAADAEQWLVDETVRRSGTTDFDLVVGHSLGANFLWRLLADGRVTARRVVLIAPLLPDLPNQLFVLLFPVGLVGRAVRTVSGLPAMLRRRPGSGGPAGPAGAPMPSSAAMRAADAAVRIVGDRARHRVWRTFIIGLLDRSARLPVVTEFGPRTLVVVGRGDLVVRPRPTTQRVAGLLGGHGQVVVLAGGHSPHRTQPAVLAQLIRDHLSTEERPILVIGADRIGRADIEPAVPTTPDVERSVVR